MKSFRTAGGDKSERRAAASREPWPQGLRRGHHADGAPDPESAAPGAVAAPAPLHGVERRLIRRAEALWDHLQGNSLLPPASAVRAFEGSAFQANSLVVSMPPQADGGRARPLLVRIGEGLVPLVAADPGPVRPDEGATAPLIARLVALAERATRQGFPAVMEIDGPRAPAALAAAAQAAAAPGGQPRGGLLLRAIALPFSPPAPDTAASVVIVATWRQLLSPTETDSLCRELAAAIDWLKGAR